MAGPQSAYRLFTGVYKDTINANLSTNYASGVTSIVLQNVVGTPATAQTMTIVDGPLTEQVAVSAWNSGTSTATVAATANAHSANVYVFFQLTSGIGPSALLRMTKVEATDNYDNKLYDTGYRGSQAMQFGAQQGMRVGNLSFEGDLFPDEFGWILGSFFGAYDYTATSGSSPTTFAFSPQNTGNGQPTPYVFYVYNPGDNTLSVYAKAVISDLTIKFDPVALTQWTASGMSFARGVISSPSAATALGVGFSSFKPLPSRQGAITIAGTYTGVTESLTYTFKREEFAPIYTLQGIQDPLALFSGPVSCTVATSLVMTDDTIYNDYINITQPTFQVSALQGTGTASNGLVIHNNVANFEDIKVGLTGKAYVTLDGSFTGLANTTDASTAGTGYSPAKVTLSVGTNSGSSSTPY
jgi:hypothetical protein